jgi:hypothetical protein
MDAEKSEGEGEYDYEEQAEEEDEDEMCNLDNQDDERKRVVHAMTPLNHKR